jgi:hypothetical protein
MKVLLSCLIPLLALLPVASAQEADGSDSVVVDKLVFRIIPYPEGVDWRAVDPVVQLHERTIQVRQPSGAVTEVVNVERTDEGWLVIDTATEGQAIEAAVAKVIASLTRSPAQEPPADLVLETYVPRFVEAARLYQLLKPLQRTVWDAPAPGRGQREGRANVTFQESPSLLVLQDTAGQVARMRALLAQVDRPAPQMLLTCWLVSESVAGAAPGAALPPELAENLRRLLPWSQPHALATAMLRMSVVAGDERRLQGIYDAGDEGREEFQLVFKPAGVDESGRQLALQRIQFESSAGQGFDTSAVLTVGEYTVLGVAGDRPLLVALRATPLER